ncbi:Rieske 2Fe-2S domain-containing protein [Phormidium tenue FACHB-886]|nr:Rieske 2Fe-2S domain-containing protein [Phormidium tenue FACHB-886]
MTMLEGSPWLLAHRSMLKPNQPMKVSLYGKDYVLWQDSNGKISALPNACPHMGAMLSEGWCVARPGGSSAVVCPFHALEFDDTGCTVLPGSNKPTKSLLNPLELVIQEDFVWSYGGVEPKIPIPTILSEFADQYDFIGFIGNWSVRTNLLSMLLIMHDYNHPNGTHRALFEIEEVQFKKFIDNGLHSHAYYDTPRAKNKFQDILENPAVLALPKVMNIHVENFFPMLVVLHGDASIGSVKQCHLFVPESETQTRTYVLMFGKAKYPIANLAKHSFLKLVEAAVEQDTDILGKLYPNATGHIKLNNEVGMDWVKRNYENFPAIVKPNLSQ